MDTSLPLVYAKLVELTPHEFEEWYVSTLVENQLMGTLADYLDKTKVVFEHALERGNYRIFYWAFERGIPTTPLLSLIKRDMQKESSPKIEGERGRLIGVLCDALTVGTDRDLSHCASYFSRIQSYTKLAFWMRIAPEADYSPLECVEFSQPTPETTGEFVKWLLATNCCRMRNLEILVRRLMSVHSHTLGDYDKDFTLTIRQVLKEMDLGEMKLLLKPYLGSIVPFKLSIFVRDIPALGPWLNATIDKPTLADSNISILEFNEFRRLAGCTEQLRSAIAAQFAPKGRNYGGLVLVSRGDESVSTHDFYFAELQYFLEYCPEEIVAKYLGSWEYYYNISNLRGNWGNTVAVMMGRLNLVPIFGGNFTSMFRGMYAATGQSPHLDSIILQWLDRDPKNVNSNGYTLLKELDCTEALSSAIFSRLPKLNAGDFINFSRYLNGNSLRMLAAKVRPNAKQLDLALTNALSTDNWSGLTALVRLIIPNFEQLKYIAKKGTSAVIEAYLTSKPSIDGQLVELLYFTYVSRLSTQGDNAMGEALRVYINPRDEALEKLEYLIQWFGTPRADATPESPAESAA